jgi:4-aminobutyrate aminotransferase/(S)-3-amino-2-methylpropionate transaminase
MIAFELVHDRQGKAPNGKLARRILDEAAARGLLLLPCGADSNVIRLLPPLITSDDQVVQAMDTLAAALVASGA